MAARTPSTRVTVNNRLRRTSLSTLMWMLRVVQGTSARTAERNYFDAILKERKINFVQHRQKDENVEHFVFILSHGFFVSEGSHDRKAPPA
mmetsp:Transcript_21678/g.30382  ORF Transcript_21678/g.30382 Transcript_21678/m.30382 type:complete len:91 (+) Transcript_21678:162-434(+)